MTLNPWMLMALWASWIPRQFTIYQAIETIPYLFSGLLKFRCLERGKRNSIPANYNPFKKKIERPPLSNWKFSDAFCASTYLGPSPGTVATPQEKLNLHVYYYRLGNSRKNMFLYGEFTFNTGKFYLGYGTTLAFVVYLVARGESP